VRVRHGWSGEIKPNQWAKLDIELEEDDLRRLLLAAKVPVDDVTVLLPAAYQLLEAEAEILLYATLMTRYEFPEAEARTRIADLTKIKNQVLGQITAPVLRDE
jgi:hypothetical protein